MPRDSQGPCLGDQRPHEPMPRSATGRAIIGVVRLVRHVGGARSSDHLSEASAMRRSSGCVSSSSTRPFRRRTGDFSTVAAHREARHAAAARTDFGRSAVAEELGAATRRPKCGVAMDGRTSLGGRRVDRRHVGARACDARHPDASTRARAQDDRRRSGVHHLAGALRRRGLPVLRRGGGSDRRARFGDRGPPGSAEDPRGSGCAPVAA